MKFTQNDILNLMQGKAYRPLLLTELMGVLSVPKKTHEASGKDGKREGRIIRVLERFHKKIVGRFERGRNFGFIIPTDKKICYDLFVAPKNIKGARDGDLVVAEITSYPQKARNPEGDIIKILGNASTPGIDTEIIIEEYGLPAGFSPDILSEAESLPDEVTDEMLHGRSDLRGLMTVTIDGEMAKDFDDAVSIEKSTDGKL